MRRAHLGIRGGIGCSLKCDNAHIMHFEVIWVRVPRLIV